MKVQKDGYFSNSSQAYGGLADNEGFSGDDAHIEKPGRIIGVISGKGGVGKSTVCANLACGLGLLGKKVLIIDLDMGQRCQDILLGIEGRVLYTITDILEGTCSINQALIRDKRFKNLNLLTVQQAGDKPPLRSNELHRLITEIKPHFDFIFIDSPAGLSKTTQFAIAVSDEYIVVTTPDPTSLRGADRVAGMAEQYSGQTPNLVINRLREDLVKKKLVPGVAEILDSISLKLMGVIPEDTDISVAVCTGEPVAMQKESISGQCFRDIARRIEGEEVPFSEEDELKSGFFANLFKWRKEE